jgi:ferredoxin
MAAAVTLLTDAGADPGRVRTEAFGPAADATAGSPPHVPEDAPADGPTLTFARSGVTVRFGEGEASPWGSLLEVAEAADVPVGWSCRTGVCHRCETGLVSGEVSYRPEPLDAPAPGNALLCVAVPAGDVTLDL